MFYVYMLLREDGMTPFYIGKGKGMRWRDHWYPSRNKNCGIYKRRIIDKMRGNGVIVPKIKIAQGLTERQAFNVEMTLIAAYGRRDNRTGILANLTDGGDGPSGAVVSEETKALKRSRPGPNRGRIFNAMARANMSAAHKGKPLSEKQIAAGLARRGKPGPNKGRTFSEVVREKMSMAKKGKPGPRLGSTVPHDVRVRISEKLKGRPFTEERKFALRMARRRTVIFA